jgi:hypothetical protein
MSFWSVVAGVRSDLPLRYKWWHYAAIGLGIVSAAFFALAAGGRVEAVDPVLTVDNTYSLNLLNFAKGRPGRTTLTEFRHLSGTLGEATPSGAVQPLKLVPGREEVVCDTPPHFAAGDAFTEDGLAYVSIPDSSGQPEGAPRHCAATSFYRSRPADDLAVFLPTSANTRKQAVRRFVAGAIAAVVWLLIYLNVYYRGLIPIYARRRAERHRQQRERFGW